MRPIDLTYPPTPTLNFKFSYSDISDAVYLEDNNSSLPLTLKLFNEGNNSIKFEDTSSNSVGENNYHFALKFPKGIFKDFNETTIEPSSEWDVGYVGDGDVLYDIVYFLSKSEKTLEPNQTTDLTLDKFYAAAVAGVQTSTVSLLYGSALKDNNDISFQDNQGIYPQKEKQIKLINQRKNPFTVDFQDSDNTILSNGQPQNLTLLITNVSPYKILLTQSSKFILNLVADDNLDNTAALATETQLDGINIEAFDSTMSSGGNVDPVKWAEEKRSTTQWAIALGPNDYSKQWEMAPGAYIKIEIKNIITNHNNGQTILSVNCENVADYLNRTFEVPIIKEGGAIRFNGRIKDQMGWVTPVGAVILYAGETAPEGWLLCDGSSYETEKYSQLHEVLKKDVLPNPTNQSGDETLKYIIKA